MESPSPRPTACTCPDQSDFVWRHATNENGWTCLACNLLAPGDPPGYRPDLDVSDLEGKVESLMMSLHMGDFVYLSNSTDGDCCVGHVLKECRATGYFDQYSIISAIMGYANDGHAGYWKEQGDAIRAGRDPRDRCACGKLATSHRVLGNGQPPVGRCGDCSVDDWMGLLAVEPRDPSLPESPDPWAVYGEWVEMWREEHPEDDRDLLTLTEEYGRASTESIDAASKRAERKGANHV